MKVVFDTNVVVSRYLSEQGTPAIIYQSWEEAAFILLVSEPILAEYQRALGYEHLKAMHHMDDQTVAQVIIGIRELATIIEPTELLEAVRDDPTDNKFLECAIAGGADYIVSGDKHLLQLQTYSGIPILSPAAFLTRLMQQP